jgi:hypothetical protein
MDYFSLSLLSRLSLAILSGLLPSILIFSTDRGLSTYGEDLFFAPYSISLALLVLVPFIHSRTYRFTRATILVVAAVVNLTFAYCLAQFLGSYMPDNSLSIIFPVLLGTLIITLTTALIAPIKITVRYVAYAFAAGLIAGWAFWTLVFSSWNWLCFDPCPWWNDLSFAGGWITWHTLIFVSIKLGEQPGSSI